MAKRRTRSRGQPLTPEEGRLIVRLFRQKRGAQTVEACAEAIAAGGPDGVRYRISASHLYKVLGAYDRKGQGAHPLTEALEERMAAVLGYPDVAGFRRAYRRQDASMDLLDVYRHEAEAADARGDHEQAIEQAARVCRLITDVEEVAPYMLLRCKHLALTGRLDEALEILHPLKLRLEKRPSGPGVYLLLSRTRGRIFKYTHLAEQRFSLANYAGSVEDALRETREFLERYKAFGRWLGDQSLNAINLYYAHGQRELATLAYLQGHYRKARSLFGEARKRYWDMFPEPICNADLGVVECDTLLEVNARRCSTLLEQLSI
jgi:tetratricopeptide (TPR) repeat protein